MVVSILENTNEWVYNRSLYEHITFPIGIMEIQEGDSECFKIIYTVTEGDECVIIDDREAAEKVIAALTELQEFDNYNIQEKNHNVVVKVYDDSSEVIISLDKYGDVTRRSVAEVNLTVIGGFVVMGDQNIEEQELRGVFRVRSGIYIYIYESNHIIVDSSSFNYSQSDIKNYVSPVCGPKFVTRLFNEITIDETFFINGELRKYAVASSI